MSKVMHRVFAAEYAKRLKINYKNGQSYHVKEAVMISVYQTIGGGHNVRYTFDRDDGLIHSNSELEFRNLRNILTKGDDVVSIELKGASIDGIKLDYVKQVFKK